MTVEEFVKLLEQLVGSKEPEPGQSALFIPNEVKENIKKVEGVSDVSLNLVWEPPWDREKMSEAAKLELNL